MSEVVTILIIDDEPPIRRFLKASLPANEFRLIEAENGEEGIHITAAKNPEVVLLDLGLPDLDGIEVTRRIREWSEVPIIVLSARGQEKDKIEALDAGADDYLTKPFGIGELVARMRVALRHKRQASSASPEPVFTFEELTVDIARRRVIVREVEVKLTPIEFKLLTLLVRHAGLVLTHTHILREVWGPAYVNEVQYLRVYMTQLRHKIEREPANPKMLLTEPGVGYRFMAE